MENHVKAQLNSIIEEECILIIKLVPLILKEFYFSLSQLLFINLPNIKAILFNKKNAPKMFPI